jgi:hypothetical protein
MNKLITFVPIMLSTMVVSAAEPNFDSMSKQLGIMENIIQSSISPRTERGSSSISSIESTYLKGQGALFTIRSSTGGSHFQELGFSAPMPPKVFLSDSTVKQIEEAAGLNSDVDIEETIAEAMESVEHAYESMYADRGHFRDLADEQRDIAYELRDIEREVRDAQYQLKRVEEKEKIKLKEKVKALGEKKNKLNKERNEIAKRSAEYQKKQAEAQAKREQKRQVYYNELSSSIADTLCLYGNGLKQLPKGEKVTVILKSGGERISRQYKDKIHVFSKRDINGCATDEINAAKLLERSSSYQF